MAALTFLFVGTSPNPRGSEQHMVTLVLALRGLGHEVTVLTRRDGFAWSALAAHGVTLRHARFGFAFDPRGLWPLLALARRLRPTWIVAGMAKEYYPALFAAWLCGAKSALFRHMDKPLSKLKQWCVERFCTRFFTVSEAAKRSLAAAGMRKVRVLYNPIALAPLHLSAGEDAERRRALDIPDHAPVVGFVGTFSTSKGVLVLRQALDRLMAEDPRLHALWLGAGDAREALGAGASPRHHFLPWQSELRLAYAAMDVVVIPSLARESASRVAAEAQALGRLVSGSAVGGIPEMTCPEQRGALVAGGDATALSTAIKRVLMLSAGERAVLQAAGRRYVAEMFAAEKVAAAFVAQLSGDAD